jgi:hypothetical protein
MTRPEDALERARAAAEAKRALGEYPPGGPAALDASFTSEIPPLELVYEWAAMSPDPDLVYSTRRLGAPITAVKRLLMRLLGQYHDQIESQQTRFNIAMVTRLRELEQRVERLERPAE